MSEQEVPLSIEQHRIIFFSPMKMCNLSEILKRLQAQYCDATPSKTQVFNWTYTFWNSWDKVENQSNKRRLATRVNEGNNRGRIYGFDFPLYHNYLENDGPNQTLGFYSKKHRRTLLGVFKISLDFTPSLARK